MSNHAIDKEHYLKGEVVFQQEFPQGDDAYYYAYGRAYRKDEGWLVEYDDLSYCKMYFYKGETFYDNQDIDALPADVYEKLLDHIDDLARD